MTLMKPSDRTVSNYQQEFIGRYLCLRLALAGRDQVALLNKNHIGSKQISNALAKLKQDNIIYFIQRNASYERHEYYQLTQ